jgi:hypothetical protein
VTQRSAAEADAGFVKKAAMAAGKAASMTCILYQVLPSSSDELQQRLQTVLDPKEQTTRIDVQVIIAARALE